MKEAIREGEEIKSRTEGIAFSCWLFEVSKSLNLTIKSFSLRPLYAISKVIEASKDK